MWLGSKFHNSVQGIIIILYECSLHQIPKRYKDIGGKPLNIVILLTEYIDYHRNGVHNIPRKSWVKYVFTCKRFSLVFNLHTFVYKRIPGYQDNIWVAILGYSLS